MFLMECREKLIGLLVRMNQIGHYAALVLIIVGGASPSRGL